MVVVKQTPDFYQEVVSRLGGETLTRCYQCGTCASSCPIATITTRFNPRLIIKRSIAGDRESVVSNEPIWLCCSCYSCQERCPQKVEIAEVIYVLRNIALREGYVPKAFIEMSSNLIAEGRVVPATAFAVKSREKFRLPPLKTTGIEALNKILSTTSFTEAVEKAKRRAI